MTDPIELLPRKNLLVMQIIASALMLGVIIFLIIALVIVNLQNQGVGMIRGGDVVIVTLVAGLGLIMTSVVSFIMPGFQTRSGLASIASSTWQPPRGANPAAFATDAPKLLALRQVSMMLALAPLEGAAFLGCIAYLLEARLMALGIVAVALLFMLMNFPTEYRVRTWLETQKDKLELMRQQT